MLSRQIPVRWGGTRGEDVISWFRLLQDTPHALHKIPSMTPVALRIQVSENERFLQAKPDRSDRAGDLALHEGFAARRSLMIEQDAVRCMKSVGFPVVHRYPIGIEFGGCIWRARVKGCLFALRNFADRAVQF